MQCPNGISVPCPPYTGSSADLFLSMINAIIGLQCAFNPRTYLPVSKSATLKFGQQYDFIVIGVGAAGYVLSNRLTENSNWTVLFLGYGEYPTSTAEIPGLARSLPPLDETLTYYSEPSDFNCLGFKDKKCRYYVSRNVGGFATNDRILYQRGRDSDYNRWSFFENNGWRYKDVSELFQKSEDCLSDPNNNRHGKGGLLKTARPDKNYGKMYQPILNAIIESGETIKIDEGEVGYFQALTNIYQGKRFSSAKAFLAPAKDRPNLTMGLDARVLQLVFNEQKETTSIYVRVNCEVIEIRAKKDIILTSGSIINTKMLLNSGIGPAKAVANLGINLVMNLPVGRSLLDHYRVTLFVKLNDFASDVKSPADITNDIFDYFTDFTGPYSTVGMADIVGYIKTPGSQEDSDIQVTFAHYTKSSDKFLDFIRDYNDASVNSLQNINKNFNILAITLTILYPYSTGSVEVPFRDFTAVPLIYPGYFTDNNGEDMKAILSAIDYVTTFLTLNTMKAYSAEFVNFNVPNCLMQFGSKAYWDCYARNFASSRAEFSGTCRMASRDIDGVVDDELNVYGVKYLKIVDPSIMPAIVAGNLVAPSIMIAEKAANIIKNDYS